MKARSSLTMAESFRLMTLVQAEYTARGTSDVEFAEHATKALGFSVNHNNVASARNAFSIPSTKYSKPPSPTVESLFQLLLELEKRVRALEDPLGH